MAHAHGKVILLGEHAVVYGSPALAAGIAGGARARAQASASSQLRCADETVRPGEGRIGQAFGALLDAIGSPPVEVQVDLELPAGCGLGASAAMGVAVARAILELGHPELASSAQGGDCAHADYGWDQQVDRAAAAWERVFHANPSGVDAAAAAVGGCLYFTRAGGPRRIPVARPLNLAIAVAGPPASTREMVEALARLRERRPAFVDRTLGLIQSLVEDARRCIATGDANTLGQLMDLNHMLLAGLMLSTPELEDAVRIARDAGALGAKLTGSGGGGCVFALTEDSPSRVLEAWQARQLRCFATTVAAASVCEGHAQ